MSLALTFLLYSVTWQILHSWPCKKCQRNKKALEVKAHPGTSRRKNNSLFTGVDELRTTWHYLYLVLPCCHTALFGLTPSDACHKWRMAFTETVSWAVCVPTSAEIKMTPPMHYSSPCHTAATVFADHVLCLLQLRDLEMSHQYEDRSSDSTFRDSRSHSQDNPEPLDLPMPTCFRSRSHSYLRAIQAGCSQDDDTASMDSGCSPPHIDTTVRTYNTSTGRSLTEKHMYSFKLINNMRGFLWVLTTMQCYVLPDWMPYLLHMQYIVVIVHICFGYTFGSSFNDFCHMGQILWLFYFDCSS